MTDVTGAALIGVVGTAALGGVGYLLTAWFSSMRNGGRDAERFKDHEQKLGRHEGFHQQHFERFNSLHHEFPSRTELTDKLEVIRESQRRTEDLALFLVKKEAVPPEGR